MSIEVGQVVYVKTTDEPCLVVNVKEGEIPSHVDATSFSGRLAIVHRPVLTEQGIKHTVDEFLFEELESRQDKEQRVFNEMEGIRAQFKAPLSLVPETKN